MRAAPIIHDSVNLIQDERARRAQHSPAGFGSEQQIQRLRRGNQNVRRFFDQRLALRGSRIAGANFGAHIDVAAFVSPSNARIPASGSCKIFADIVAQRFERRDVNDLRFIRQISPSRLRGTAHPAKQETPPAFCPSPSAQKSARAGRIELPASRAACGSVGDPNVCSNHRATAG